MISCTVGSPVAVLVEGLRMDPSRLALAFLWVRQNSLRYPVGKLVDMYFGESRPEGCRPLAFGMNPALSGAKKEMAP